MANNRIEFNLEPKTSGVNQAKVSKSLCEYLAAKKPFFVEFGYIKKSKTYQQLRYFYRIFELYALRLTEYQGEEISKERAKELFKYEFEVLRLCNYDEAFGEASRWRREQIKSVTLHAFNQVVKRLQETYKVPKSLADLTREEAHNIIEQIQEKWVRKRGWQEMEVLPEDLRKLNEYYESK